MRSGTLPRALPTPVTFVTGEAIQAVWKSMLPDLPRSIHQRHFPRGRHHPNRQHHAGLRHREDQNGLPVLLSPGRPARDIRRQFLLEAALLALGGGAVGVFLGWLIAYSVDAFTPLPTRVPLSLVVTGLCLAALTGIVAGVFPAIKASRLPPIEALRYE